MKEGKKGKSKEWKEDKLVVGFSAGEMMWFLSEETE